MAISTSSVPMLVSVNRRISAFWSWWTGDLSALVPKRLAMAFAGDASLADIAIDQNALVHVKASGATLQELKRVPIDPANPLSSRVAVEELVKRCGREVRIVVPSGDVLRKKISLPIATEENLLDVVGFEMDRHTPFTRDQVYYGTRIVTRDPVRERINVILAAIPRVALEPALSQLRAAGVSVHSIVVSDEVTGAAAPIELLPKSAEPTRRWSAMQRLNVALIAGGVLLALAAVVLPIWQKREQVKELIPLSAKAGADFKVTQRVSDEYTRLANEYNFIVGKKHAHYPAVMLLDEITKISPDTTWIQSFELKTLPKTRELQLTGEATSVSKVIESLEQTAFLHGTVQRQQSRQGSRPNIEFFTLASEVKPRPLPEKILPDAAVIVPVAAAPAPPAGGTNTAPVAVVTPVVNAAPVPPTGGAISKPLAAPPSAAANPTPTSPPPAAPRIVPAAPPAKVVVPTSSPPPVPRPGLQLPLLGGPGNGPMVSPNNGMPVPTPATIPNAPVMLSPAAPTTQPNIAPSIAPNAAPTIQPPIKEKP